VLVYVAPTLLGGLAWPSAISASPRSATSGDCAASVEHLGDDLLIVGRFDGTASSHTSTTKEEN
jgi:diaminohydroxyphosphoribosylaminopyrimidine deaminase/5-amino-6-(5-phosphoribosylamino)uracil reductase